MIWFILIDNCHEIETDDEEFFRKTIRELNKSGKVEGINFIITEISPGSKGREVKPRP